MVIIMIKSSIGLFTDDFHDYLDEFGEIEYYSCFCKLSQKRLLRRNNWKLQSIPKGADTTVGQILLSRDFLDRNLRLCIDCIALVGYSDDEEEMEGYGDEDVGDGDYDEQDKDGDHDDDDGEDKDGDEPEAL